jgi:hypothetical protein
VSCEVCYCVLAKRLRGAAANASVDTRRSLSGCEVQGHVSVYIDENGAIAEEKLCLKQGFLCLARSQCQYLSLSYGTGKIYCKAGVLSNEFISHP